MMVVSTLTARVVVVVQDVGIRMEGDAEVEMGEFRENTTSSSIHQLPHPGQEAGVELGGTETATGTTLIKDLVVGTDTHGDTSVTNRPLK